MRLEATEGNNTGEISGTATMPRTVLTDSQNLQRELAERDVEILSAAVRSIVELRPGGNIWRVIAARIQDFAPNSIVLTSAYHAETSTLNVKAVNGLNHSVEKIINILGKHPAHLSVDFNENACNGILEGRLRKLSDGLYEAATGTVPVKICRAIEKLLDVTGVYGIGLNWSGTVLGGVIILLQENAEIHNPSIIESFVNFAAIALHRRTSGMKQWS
jgi:hypothetical protein